MAFSKLPEDVMTHILKNLDSVQDISNLFEAFPETKGLIQPIFNSKRNNWIFTLILPHILPWLNKKDILNSRQVCKQWTSSVDHFLQNHPSQRAYDPEIQPQPWLPILKSPSTRYPPMWAYQNMSSNELETGSGIRFDSRLMVLCFLFKSLAFNYPQERNPFIGRSVSISDNLVQNYICPPFRPISESTLCLDTLIHIFQRFGDHVWFLDIARRDEDSINVNRRLYDSPEILNNPIGFSNLVLGCLKHVPNLRSLQLKLKGKKLDVNIEDISEIPSIPALQHLETLGVISSDLPIRLVNILVTNYSSQLKSLSINEKFWRDEYSNLFPRLTEFQFVEETPTSEETISNLISSLEAPQLWKLQLSLLNPEFVVEDKILPWLKRFPRLESLTLDINYYSCRLHDICEENAGGKSSPEKVDSLKHLWINNYAGGNERILELLRSFPSLESLAIYPKLRYSGCFKHENMYEPTLWELLPKLKKITALGIRDIENKRVPNRVYHRPVQYD